MLGYLAILNNYLHDVATAMIISLTLLMSYIGNQVNENSRPEEKKLFIKIYRYFSMIAVISLVWIVVGGIPRVLAFNRYELIPAGQKGIVTVLMFKHLILFGLVLAGIFLWRKIKKKAEKMSIF
ncbi:hypothetical protein [Phosphitispora sp. TUW77]|uniref:hypothetical protein n=1 Tax=Phosphitispora sp. TUW77 TaxID=3152361 RepID=UPI003AB2C28B